MISRIHLSNFQSHKDTKIDFDEGVNIITGSSDSGKTAILRALNWVIYNRPLGDSFISHGEEHSFVELHLDANAHYSTKPEGIPINYIIRAKDKKNNTYKYIWDNLVTSKGEDEYSSVGSEVPEQIKRALNISDINIQQQLDAPFLLSKTAGEISKYLNQIVHLDKIDIAFSNIEKRRRRVTRDIDYTEGEKGNLEIELEDYANLDSIEEKLEYVEGLEKDIYDTKMKTGSIETIIENYKKSKELADSYNIIILSKEKIKEGLEKLVDKEKELIGIAGDIKSINYILTDIEEQQEFINTMDECIKEKEKMFNEIMPNDICPLCEQEIKK